MAMAVVVYQSISWRCFILVFFFYLTGLTNHGDAMPTTIDVIPDKGKSPADRFEYEEDSAQSTKVNVLPSTSTLTTSPKLTGTIIPPTQDPDHNLIIIFDTNTSINPTTTTASKSCTRNCCSLGRMSGRKGYLCIALPNFSRIFNTLLHPYKTKQTHPRVIGRGIERCALHPARKRIYEQCCEEAQQYLRNIEERVKECEARLGRGKCNHLHHKTPECY